MKSDGKFDLDSWYRGLLDTKFEINSENLGIWTKNDLVGNGP